MSKSSQSSLFKTNVRLPKKLHTRVRQVVALNGETLQQFFLRAAENELESGRSSGQIATPVEWDALLAQRFLECLPTPAVIKDSKARIVWCNFAYEDLFDRPRTHLLNRKVDELGLFAGESEVRLRRDNLALERAKVEEAKHFWEPLTLLSRGTALLFSAHRFVFRRQSPRTAYLGDISFDWSQVLPGYVREPHRDLLKRLRGSAVGPEISQLFPVFLQTCPAAIAIKQKDGRLAWCNQEYTELTGKPLSEMQGLHTTEIFKIPATHPVVQSEFTVANSNVWMYAVEEVPPNNKPRTSLRFPIVGGHGRPHFIGVISAEFRQEDVSFHDLRPRKPSKRRVAVKLPKNAI